jgi:hypothetical protein
MLVHLKGAGRFAKVLEIAMACDNPWSHWIGWRENLQETHGFLPLNMIIYDNPSKISNYYEG